MNQDNYITLIYKKLKKEISPAEQEDLQQWLGAHKENTLLKQQIEENWQLSKKALPPISIDAKKDFAGFKKRMRAEKAAINDPPKEAIVRPLNRQRRWLAIAAAIALPLMAAIWVFRPAPAASMLMAQTNSKETKEILLEDGTKITLNENSSLKYPETFAANSRQVRLEGEAYFEVESNPNRPFEVLTENTRVKVLGTVFNVRSKTAEYITKVNVEEGKVQFSSTIIGKGVILTKGEEGTFDVKNSKITERVIDNKNASAWKSKVLTYKQTPLKVVLEDLAKHFGVNATITNEAMQTCRVTARLTSATPKVVLDYIVSVYQMELQEIDDQTFELTNGVCK